MESDSRSALPRRALDATVEVGARTVAEGAELGYRILSNLPVVGEVLRHGARSASDRLFAEVVDARLRDARSVVVQAIYSVINEMDLTPLIRDRIDLNQLLEMIDMDEVLARVDVVPLAERLNINDVVSQLDVDSVVARLDINSVVGRLDLDAVVGRLDVDALIARLDLDSVVGRIDLVALLTGIVDRVSLPALIRISRRNAAADPETDTSVEGEPADAAVTRVVKSARGRPSRGRKGS
jgi:hypothetical protein